MGTAVHRSNKLTGKLLRTGLNYRANTIIASLGGFVLDHIGDSHEYQRRV